MERQKICYIILTCKKYTDTRCKWQRENCFKNIPASDYYYLSCSPDKDSIYGWGTSDDYYSCPLKYIAFFQNMNLNYDWYVFIDDDAFVFPDRMYKTLEKFDKLRSLYIGIQMSHLKNLTFMSGGAGFVLSHSAYNMVKTYVRNSDMVVVQQQRQEMGQGDVSIGQWISNINTASPNSITLSSTGIFFSYLPHQNDIDLHRCETFHYLKTEDQYILYGKLIK